MSMSSPSSPGNDTALESKAGSEPKPAERLRMDDMLQKYCGEFGPWQIRHFILTSLVWALEAIHTMVMIFADREPPWKCTRPGCNSGSRSVCGFRPGSWEWVGGEGSSTVAQWRLVCGDKYKVGLVQAMFFVGSMIGAGIFGHLSDSKLGRKGSLTIVCILNPIFGIVTSLSPSYLIYLLLRFLTGLSIGSVGLCAYVLGTETLGPTSRTTAGMSTLYFFSAGIAILSGIAYLFRSWRTLYIVSSVPSVLFLIFALPFISESPRWYLVQGRVNEAMKIMRAIAKSNGRDLPDGVILALDEDKDDKEQGENNKYSSNDQEHNTKQELETTEAKTGSLIDVVKSPMMRIRLFLSVAINFLCSVVYYGISLNVVNLKTNIYLNVFLNAMAEMPAFAITALLLNRLGRKPLTIGTQWFSGLFCVTAACLTKNIGMWKVARMICGVLGIFGMAGTYNLLILYTAELFPTVVRNAALGCATQATQIGAILAPFVVVLGGTLSFMVFAICGILGGIFACFLTETLNKPMYDTMAEMKESESSGRVV